MNEMGKRIREKRTEYNMTMNELAEKLGVQASAVNKWEKGAVENIKRSTIAQMGKLFNCSPAWLMGLEDVNPEIPSFDPRHIELVDTFSKLTPDQQEHILNTMKLFLSGNN